MNVERVAPATALPPTSHWYVSRTGTGPYAPGRTRSVRPTFAVPFTVGRTRTAMVPGATFGAWRS
ncbi:hypothetical protein E0W78_06440 [Aeromicrobium sp. IC_218]|nr:hypothetical protein E0W78_06440 [Aeromicrobium sp. IC_218]